MTDLAVQASGGMMLAMGLFCILMMVLGLLSIAALIKYLTGTHPIETNEENSRA